jgi:hypothetical protein
VYEAFVERGVEVDVASSGDGGRTWSQPRVVARQDRGVFGPSLAGVPGGALAATYYGREMRGTASFWIATSRDGTRWQRRRLAAPFDLTRAPRSDGAAFLGDYSGLTAAGGVFVATFAVAPPLAEGRSDIFAARFLGITTGARPRWETSLSRPRSG